MTKTCCVIPIEATREQALGVGNAFSVSSLIPLSWESDKEPLLKRVPSAEAGRLAGAVSTLPLGPLPITAVCMPLVLTAPLAAVSELVEVMAGARRVGEDGTGILNASLPATA